MTSKCLYSTLVRKRFYKNVSIISATTPANAVYSKVDNYEICLDGKKVKTPKRQVLTVPTKPLALAVAQEWTAQEKNIKTQDMHLTGLCITCLDNPVYKTEQSLIQSIKRYLDNDCLLFFQNEPEGLKELQQKMWTPVIDWTNGYFGTKLEPSESLIGPEIPTDSRDRFERYLATYDFWRLMGLEYGAESIKSLLLTLATTRAVLTVSDAVRLGALETQFQTSRWGTVPWAHGVEELETRCRLAAAVTFVRLLESHSASTSKTDNAMSM